VPIETEVTLSLVLYQRAGVNRSQPFYPVSRRQHEPKPLHTAVHRHCEWVASPDRSSQFLEHLIPGDRITAGNGRVTWFTLKSALARPEYPSRVRCLSFEARCSHRRTNRSSAHTGNVCRIPWTNRQTSTTAKWHRARARPVPCEARLRR